MKIDPIEKYLFLEGILLRYGYDFRQYAESSLNRRLESILREFHHTSLLDTLKVILKSTEQFREILPLLTIYTTSFFRDPLFFRALREKVFPVLKTYPSLKIWVAGCSSGEELVSLSIALMEEGLLSRSILYATDINPVVLKKAKDGIYDSRLMQTFAKNYVAAGGEQSPSHYYTAEYGLVRFHPMLRENVLFSEHNLVTDSVFAEMNLILCRNVLIYFTSQLQNRVFNLFAQSLGYRGFLAIGSKESIRFSAAAPLFETISLKENIYQLKTNYFSLNPLTEKR